MAGSFPTRHENVRENGGRTALGTALQPSISETDSDVDDSDLDNMSLLQKSVGSHGRRWRSALTSHDQATVFSQSETVRETVPHKDRVKRQVRSSETNVTELIGALLSPDERGADEALSEAFERSAGFTSLISETFTVAARRMNDLWLDDQCDFNDVTLAVLRMQRFIRQRDCYPAPSLTAPAILLSSLNGEQHGLGLTIVEAVFREAGWAVETWVAASVEALTERLAQNSFACVGLSYARAPEEAELAGLVASLKANTLDENLSVIVGGAAVLAKPDIFVRAGVDLLVDDAASAPRRALDLIQKSLDR
ncbi:MAG: hypothetical protein AAF850_01025 [Pseudomonadota bacterium]